MHFDLRARYTCFRVKEVVEYVSYKHTYVAFVAWMQYEHTVTLSNNSLLHLLLIPGPSLRRAPHDLLEQPIQVPHANPYLLGDLLHRDLTIPYSNLPHCSTIVIDRFSEKCSLQFLHDLLLPFDRRVCSAFRIAPLTWPTSQSMSLKRRKHERDVIPGGSPRGTCRTTENRGGKYAV